MSIHIWVYQLQTWNLNIREFSSWQIFIFLYFFRKWSCIFAHFKWIQVRVADANLLMNRISSHLFDRWDCNVNPIVAKLLNKEPKSYVWNQPDTFLPIVWNREKFKRNLKAEIFPFAFQMSDFDKFSETSFENQKEEF